MHQKTPFTIILIILRRNTSTKASIIPRQRDDLAEDADRVGIDRLHFRVFGLEAVAAVLLEEALDRGFVVDHGDDDLAVFGVLALFDDDDVAVQDADVAHTFALDAKRKERARVKVLFGGIVDEAVEVLDRQNRRAGGDLS